MNSKIFRDAVGLVLMALSLALLFGGVRELRGHDYVASLILIMAGFGLTRSATELLRPSIGE